MTGYRISILKKAIRYRIVANMKPEETRCPKVWEGERCMLTAPHDVDCIIGTLPDPRPDSATGAVPSLPPFSPGPYR